VTEVLEAARDEIAAQEYQANETLPSELEQDTSRFLKLYSNILRYHPGGTACF